MSALLVIGCLWVSLPGVPAPMDILYPFGPQAGDNTGRRTDWNKWNFRLSSPIPLFGSNYRRLYISPDGFIDSQSTAIEDQMNFGNFPGSNLLLMAFGNDWSFRKGVGQAWYAREVLSGPELARATADVNSGLRSNSKQPTGDFSATSLLVVTYYQGSPFPGYGFKRNTIQIVIVTDSRKTYVMYNYGQLEWTKSWNVLSKVGFYHRGASGNVYVRHPYSKQDRLFELESTSNVHVDGRLMFQVDVVCDTDLCDNGICLENDYCLCYDGYTGNTCATEIDDCESNPCWMGSCTDGVQQFTCDCYPGYAGPLCDHDIDYCNDTLQFIARHDYNPCFDGTCHDGLTGYTCSCHVGYTGTRCETEINECASCPCVHGDCEDRLGYFECACNEGYWGELCEYKVDECRGNRCEHGLCIDQIEGYECRCHPGYSGDNCDIDLDECTGLPCDHGSCLDGDDHFDCECYPGFEGRLCEQEVDECDVEPCIHGTCFDGVNEYMCACEEGYTGAICENGVVDCNSTSCSNHGHCLETVPGRVCRCHRGYTGASCETDIDDCRSDPCVHGTCEDGVGTFRCHCEDGYNGSICDQDINDCVFATCLNGMCSDAVHSFNCECLPGFTGESCEQNIDDCSGRPCANGFCLDGTNLYTCSCYPGFTGGRCEIELDECSSSPCSAYGQCKDAIDGYVCDCIDGVKSVHCEVDERPAVGSFGNWGPWTTCSKLCDNGLQTRYRPCLREPCLENNDQVQLCNTVRCQGDPNEFDRMAVMLETSKSQQEVAKEESTLKQFVADSLNHFCGENRGRCCQIVNITVPTGLEHFDVFTPDDVALARGYPLMTKEKKIHIKILVSAMVGPLREACIGRARRRLTMVTASDVLYVPADILRDCISGDLERLNKATCCWTVVTRREVNMVSYILMGTLIPIAVGLLVILVLAIRSPKRFCICCNSTSDKSAIIDEPGMKTPPLFYYPFYAESKRRPWYDGFSRDGRR